MRTLQDYLSAEISISDPWETASCVTAPLRGKVVQFAPNGALIRLNEPTLIDGMLVRSVAATPRHIGVSFERSAGSIAANIVLSASDVPNKEGPGETQQAAARDPFIATIGSVSFVERVDTPVDRTDRPAVGYDEEPD